MPDRRQFLTAAGAALAAWPALRPLTWGTEPASHSEPRRILYISGRFSGHDPLLMRATVEALGRTPFNTAILAFLYVRSGRNRRLELTFNGTASPHLDPATPRLLEQLRSGFTIHKRLLISLGGWGNRSSFDAIRKSGVADFLDRFDREFVVPLGLQGLDLDLEPSTVAENTPAGWRAVHAELGSTLVELTNQYMERHPDHVVTHAPIASMAAALYAQAAELPGVPGSFFEATRRRGGGNNLAWLNVQFYEAGDPKPMTIADFYCQRLVEPLRALRARTGIAHPERVLVPGFEPKYHQAPGFCRQTLAAIQQEMGTGGGAPGYFLWDYRQAAPALREWSLL